MTGTVSAVTSFHVRAVICLVTTSNIGTVQQLRMGLLALKSLQSKQTRQTTVGRGSRETGPLSQGHHGAARSQIF